MSPPVAALSSPVGGGGPRGAGWRGPDTEKGSIGCLQRKGALTGDTAFARPQDGPRLAPSTAFRGPPLPMGEERQEHHGRFSGAL